MARVEEMCRLFEQSGLGRRVARQSVKYHESENFTKLLFRQNDWRLASVEIWDLQRGGSYVRVTHRPNVPPWFKTRLETLPNLKLRSSIDNGCSYDGHFQTLLENLVKLTDPSTHGNTNW